MWSGGEIIPRSSSALDVGARRRRSSTLPKTTTTSRTPLPKRATDSILALSTHACVFPRRTVSSDDADTVSAAGAGNAGKHVPACFCSTVLACLSDCCVSQSYGLAVIQLVTRLRLDVF